MNMRPDPATGYPGRTYRFYTGPTIYDFGYGRSYSEFSHQLVQAPHHVASPLEEELKWCSSKCNVGKIGGSHTVFLFSSPPPVHNAPQKHLVGFQKVRLTPQAEGLVKFNVNVCKHLSLL
ncbi:hypothetical protein Leryth_015032 [Lithospermum erythrorhizon]|nr:hypothetical protein Leryth_015032 [Lithospermum erythrorhizon]